MSTLENKKLRYCKAVIDVARKIKYYRIKKSDHLDGVIPTGAFSRPGSLEFFRHVKQNRLRDIEEMLHHDRFLVY